MMEVMEISESLDLKEQWLVFTIIPLTFSYLNLPLTFGYYKISFNPVI